MKKKIIIAIDAMGGENAPQKNIEGICIFLKKNQSKNDFELHLYGDEAILNKELVSKYFVELNNLKVEKYLIFEEYFNDFYNFCFELRPTNMIKDAIKFKV